MPPDIDNHHVHHLPHHIQHRAYLGGSNLFALLNPFGGGEEIDARADGGESADSICTGIEPIAGFC